MFFTFVLRDLIRRNTNLTNFRLICFLSFCLFFLMPIEHITDLIRAWRSFLCRRMNTFLCFSRITLNRELHFVLKPTLTNFTITLKPHSCIWTYLIIDDWFFCTYFKFLTQTTILVLFNIYTTAVDH